MVECMPEVIDDSVKQGQNLLVPAVAGAAGIGIGSAVLGPGIGMPLGTVVSGAYIGGTEGTIISLSGLMFGLSTLVFGSPFGGGGFGGGGQTQGVK